MSAWGKEKIDALNRIASALEKLVEQGKPSMGGAVMGHNPDMCEHDWDNLTETCGMVANAQNETPYQCTKCGLRKWLKF
jgi:hypothetical protein